MSTKRPLSELTLGEADSFLEDLICQTQRSGGWFMITNACHLYKSHVVVGSSLQRVRGEDAHEIHTIGQGMMSKDVDSTVARVEPEAVMTATCVVLSAASNVASLKFLDLTMHKVLASLQRIEGRLVDQMLTEPLNLAIDYYKTVIKAVLSDNFKLAFDTLPLLEERATKAFHYANNKKIGIESYR